jgi:hypothetical protein
MSEEDKVSTITERSDPNPTAAPRRGIRECILQDTKGDYGLNLPPSATPCPLFIQTFRSTTHKAANDAITVYSEEIQAIN